ncbi:GIY-YIG nuclease family protein [Lacrimispora aerotolerans]|uniref:GIY-YIG nuclease family protein n=1 Tax=Lacrimispora aerotolerans TaxID=36832 RepID=UPI00047B44F6|nr:GIY-YIG nuclease family protein [Lacrimispora aerotolerans]
MDKLSRKSLKEQYKSRALIGGVYQIKCKEEGMVWLRSTVDLKGAENRFLFSKSMNSCPEHGMRKLWDKYGVEAFSFEVLEELKKKETQTEEEFSEDIKILLELWQEKVEEGEGYGRED